MQANEQRLDHLFHKWRTHNIDEAESEELMDLLGNASSAEREELLKQAFGGVIEQQLFTPQQLERMANVILRKKEAAPVSAIKRLIAAASIILLLGAGVYFFFQRKGAQPAQDVAKTTLPADIEAPRAARATITLSDGRVIYLDSAGNGSLATIEAVQLVKQADGKITYHGSAAKTVYHTLTNPRGSKVIDMTLADGSRVWLNSGSSLTYPVGFPGNDRKVTITGEAYFEVAHNAGQPFKVSKGTLEVTVLGTHFNVNAYDDEPTINVTLLEGSVNVSQGAASTLLKRGQQAQVGTAIKVVSDADLGQVMAWKNGLFQFNNAGIETVMRQIARWYDVEVVYETMPADIFRGELPRSMSAANVLKVLEETGGVHFRIEGRKVVVKK